MDITAVITAGGRSSRLGRDKGLERVGGVPLVARVAASLEPFGARLLVCPDDRYAALGWPRVDDRQPPQGPLGGLAAAFDHARAPWLAFSAADLPFLTPRYWLLLAAARREGAGAVVARDAAGRPQPLAALYHRSAQPSVEACLAAGKRAMQDLLAGLEVAGREVVPVPWSTLAPHVGDRLFHNVNTENDLASARDWLGR